VSPSTVARPTPTAAAALDLAAVLVELTEYGPPSEVRNQAPRLAAHSLGLDRVLLTSVRSGELVAETLHISEGPTATDVLAELQQRPVLLEYPLVEGEIMRRRRPQLVHIAQAGRTGQHAFADVLHWNDYIVAPVVLDSHVIGFFHGDRAFSDRKLSAEDAEALGSFSLAFGLVYERSVLRTRLRVQRQEMRQVAAWADARSGELEDRLVSLQEGAKPAPGASPESASTQEANGALRDLLTRRELEVLELMVRGQTNGAIARDLVLATGTVKFHVKNILRKLHASNRAEATSRYLRLTLNR
jgi:DNA-binding CsgD family transcriptional regulator